MEQKIALMFMILLILGAVGINKIIQDSNTNTTQNNQQNTEASPQSTTANPQTSQPTGNVDSSSSSDGSSSSESPSSTNNGRSSYIQTPSGSQSSSNSKRQYA